MGFFGFWGLGIASASLTLALEARKRLWTMWPSSVNPGARIACSRTDTAWHKPR